MLSNIAYPKSQKLVFVLKLYVHPKKEKKIRGYIDP